MLASFPASMVNQKPVDLGISIRFSPISSRFRYRMREKSHHATACRTPSSLERRLRNQLLRECLFALFAFSSHCALALALWRGTSAWQCVADLRRQTSMDPAKV